MTQYWTVIGDAYFIDTSGSIYTMIRHILFVATDQEADTTTLKEVFDSKEAPDSSTSNTYLVQLFAVLLHPDQKTLNDYYNTFDTWYRYSSINFLKLFVENDGHNCLLFCANTGDHTLRLLVHWITSVEFLYTKDHKL